MGRTRNWTPADHPQGPAWPPAGEPVPHSVLELIDSAVAGRVLLFGSLPPGGRDLDVLARPPEWRAIAAVLEREGFVGRGGTWVRFRRCTAEAVDLVATREWALGPSELAALWAEATPVGGARNVARPSPRHLLLILARQLVEGDGRLSATRRSRISAALAEDPKAWYRARAAAGPWGASRALGLLRLAHEGRRRVPPVARTAARRHVRGRGTAPRWPACLLALRALVRRPRRGSLVALCGPTAATRTSQAEALRRTLEKLGQAVTVERPKPGPDWPATEDGAGWPGRAGRLASVRAAIVAVGDGWAQRRATARHLRSGRTVICDGYTLDAAVRLHQRHGGATGLGLQVRLVGLVSPAPTRAYLLDAATPARALRSERGQPGRPPAPAALYRRLHEPLGVRRLDGEADPEELCRQIAREVWEDLR